MPVVAMCVTAAEKLEQADSLFHYTFESPNQGELHIVANSTNVYSVGDVAGVAVVGTRLPGLEIKARKVFGIPSSGMACGPVDVPVDTDVSAQFNADAPLRAFTVSLEVTVEAAYAEDAGALAKKQARANGRVISTVES